MEKSEKIDAYSGYMGLVVNRYHGDLALVLKEAIGLGASFIVTPIEPQAGLKTTANNQFNAAPDFLLPAEDWCNKVCVHLGYSRIDSYNPSKIKNFKKLFDHAVYLRTKTIIVDCPTTDHGYLTLASILNKHSRDTYNSQHTPTILIRVPLIDRDADLVPDSWVTINGSDDGIHSSQSSEKLKLNIHQEHRELDEHSGRQYVMVKPEGSSAEDLNLWPINHSLEESADSTTLMTYPSFWDKWNAFRSHLAPNHKLGLYLEVNDDIPLNELEIHKWAGEPIKMISFNPDHFVRTPAADTYTRLMGRYKELLRVMLIKNSFKSKIVVDGRLDSSLADYIDCLFNIVENLKRLNNDRLRSWNDYLQIPMQPLSTNLDSGVYSTFELDSMKYIKYKDAMIAAIEKLIQDETDSRDKEFVLMVLGAGRGPLVDCFIGAIQSVASNRKFKIYALDKNFSSVRSLLHKQNTEWVNVSNYITTEVVECDMRTWEPNEKADIIATELLGSFADNELSPECIDGIWKFCKTDTISIPQSYASYIAPICSFRAKQELYRCGDDAQDRLWVSRLSNFYEIDRPQKLFEFEHRNLRIPPNQKCNERYSRLVFKSSTDTVCHGFAGYFSAELFGQITLATVPGLKTPNMDSWFPAYIPLTDVQLPEGTEMVVHFWRKESSTQVWYEWAVTSPVRTRIHSPDGCHSAMSKYI